MKGKELWVCRKKLTGQQQRDRSCSRNRYEKRRDLRTVSSPVIRPSAQAAKGACLRYVNTQEAGIIRQRKGRGFAYLEYEGKPIRDGDTLRRLSSLVIPPAWQDVWICPHGDGHLQATSRDAKGRKQYRYHSRWRESRDDNKYRRMIAFSRALPVIRRKVEKDLLRTGLPREKIPATVVKLLEVTLIRVGNEEHAKRNDSFGLTTIRDRHVHVNGSAVRFEFRGKSGIIHAVDVTERRLALIVRQSRLGHTKAVCRTCYIHPDVLNAYLEGSLSDMLSRSAGRELRSQLHDMPPEEAAVLALLYQRFQRDRRLVRG